jgi:chromosome condensin MukBEF ATPase and DNA-binding subunit MukB
MVAYLGKQHVNAAENVTPKHGTVMKLIRKVFFTFECCILLRIYLTGSL